MAITFDNASNGAGSTSNVSSISWTHTMGGVGLGSNGILWVNVVSVGAPSSVTYNGVNMTHINDENNAHLYNMLSPPTGGNTVQVNLGSPGKPSGVSSSYLGVAQVGTLGTVAVNTGSGTALSDTVSTSSANQVVIDAPETETASTFTATASQNVRAQRADTRAVALGDIAATGSGMTLTWTASISGTWNEQAVAMNPFVPAISASPSSLSFVGSGSQTVVVTDTGNGAESWSVTIQMGSAWLSTNPTNGGPLAANGTQNVTVTTSAGALAPGMYNDTLIFSSGSASFNVPVTLIVPVPAVSNYAPFVTPGAVIGPSIQQPYRGVYGIPYPSKMGPVIRRANGIFRGGAGRHGKNILRRKWWQVL